MVFADSFKTALLPPTLVALLESRFVKHFAPVCKLGFVPCWEEVISCLQRAQTHFAMAALKTLLNSWCTCRRYHEDGLDVCIFGCRCARDDISHYATCPRLWQVSCDASKVPRSTCVEVRLLLHEPSLARLDALVTAYSIYHAVKLGNPAAVREAQRSSAHAEMLSLMRREAEACAIKFGFSRRLFHDAPKAQWIKMGAKAADACSVVRCSKNAAVLPRDDSLPEPYSSERLSNLLGAGAGLLGVPDTAADERPFCEPECNGLPVGKHHACCSQSYFEAKNNLDT